MFDTLGFVPLFEERFRSLAREELAPARVVFTSREICRVLGRDGELSARLSGRLRHGADPASLPVTGDWVAVRATAPGEALVEVILPRRGVLARKEAGRASARQILAANVDVAFLVQAADRLNPRSLERYAALAWNGGALPVVVISKSDRSADLAAALQDAGEAAPGVPIHAVSALAGDGLGALAPHLPRGATAVLLGPSGAGKSTLANALAGAELLATSAVRESDGRGRHTTSARQMVPLPGGAWLLDTPGLRELGGIEADARVFGEIEELGAACRFRDCRHQGEPGCAVLAAAATGALDAGRLAGYRKLRSEAAWAAAREESTAAAVEKRRWKAVMKAARLAPTAKGAKGYR